MKENLHRIADALERGFGSRMIVEDGHILFTIPAKALIATLFGNPDCFKCASLLMQSAEYEYKNGSWWTND